MPDRVISVPQAQRIVQATKTQLNNINGRLGDLKSAIHQRELITNDVIDFDDLFPKNASAWEQGYINENTGADVDSDYRIRTVNYITLEAHKSYQFKTWSGNYNLAFFGYDASDAYIGKIRGYTTRNFVYTNYSDSDIKARFCIMRVNESPSAPLPISEAEIIDWYGYETGTLISDKLQQNKDYTDEKIVTVNEKIRGLNTDILNVSVWEQGGYGAIANYASPNPNASSIRIRTEVTLKQGSYYINVDSTKNAYVWAAFDANGNTIGSNAGWQTGKKSFTVSTETGLLRIALKNSDDSAIVPSDFLTSSLAVAEDGNIVFLSDLKKYISEPIDTPIKLKVMSYNIGRFSYGVSPYYLSENYEEKLANYRAFFSEQMADIIGLQECNTYLDTDAATGGNASVNSNIFDYLYPYHHDLNGFTCLKSKYQIQDTGTGTLTAGGRQYVYGYITLSGKTIFVMSVHLTPNAGEELEAKRTQERAQVISILAQHEYAICFGDFNAQAGTDFSDFTNAGYKISNGGYLPIVNTYGGRTVFAEKLPMDNIVVTPNIIIDNSERLMVFDKLSSDHVPIVAYLTIV